MGLISRVSSRTYRKKKNKPKMGKHRKPKTTETVLKFDKTARKEYLTGFSKRKKERQEKAKKELEEKIKKEKRDMKAEIRNASNMSQHNDIVADRLKQLRNLEGKNEDSKRIKEDDGKIVETQEIDMSVNLAPTIAGYKNAPQVETEEIEQTEEMDSKKNQQKDAEEAVGSIG